MDRIDRRNKKKSKGGKYVYSGKYVRQKEEFQKNPSKNQMIVSKKMKKNEKMKKNYIRSPYLFAYLAGSGYLSSRFSQGWYANKYDVLYPISSFLINIRPIVSSMG